MESRRVQRIELPLVRALHGESVQVEMMVEHPERAEGCFSKFQRGP
jgi:hypothetical protein